MRLLFSSRTIFPLLGLCLALPVCAAAQSQQPLSAAEIVSRMTQAQAESRQRNIAYRVTREYRLSPANATSPSSVVVAEINFVPPGAKDYNIVKAEGSNRGRTIVSKVLDHESEMAGRSQEHEVSPRNYDFALLGREMVNGRDSYVLQLSPKRKDVELLRGKAWVDAENFGILRMQGAPAKDPSMWIKNLTVTINYAEVSGVWVATSTKAVAELRFVGTHVLTSRELDLRTSIESARNQAQRVQNHNPKGQNSASRVATWVAP